MTTKKKVGGSNNSPEIIEQSVSAPFPSDGAFLIENFCTPEEKKEFARLLRIFEDLNKSEHDGVRKEILIRVEYDYRRLMDKAGRIIWENPETAWGFARARAEWNDSPLEQVKIYEEFAIEAQERAIFHPEDPRFEKLATHAKELARKIGTSLLLETQINGEHITTIQIEKSLPVVIKENAEIRSIAPEESKHPVWETIQFFVKKIYEHPFGKAVIDSLQIAQLRENIEKQITAKSNYIERLSFIEALIEGIEKTPTEPNYGYFHSILELHRATTVRLIENERKYGIGIHEQRSSLFYQITFMKDEYDKIVYDIMKKCDLINDLSNGGKQYTFNGPVTGLAVCFNKLADLTWIAESFSNKKIASQFVDKKGNEIKESNFIRYREKMRRQTDTKHKGTLEFIDLIAEQDVKLKRNS